GRGVGGTGRQRAGVARVVQRGADVVAHAPIHADVGTQAVDVLDRPDLVNRNRARPGDAAARLDGEPGPGQPGGPALPVHDVTDALGQQLDLGRLVLVGVGDAEPAAQVQLVDLHVVLVANPDGQLQHPLRGHLEPGGVEDLRPDVRVQPGQLQVTAGHHPAHRLVGGAGGQREAELLVVVRGGHELVGVRFDAGRHPDQHPGPAARWRHPVRVDHQDQPGDLLERVEHDVAHADLDGAGQLCHRLVVAVHGDQVRADPGGQRDLQLAAGAHV